MTRPASTPPRGRAAKPPAAGLVCRKSWRKFWLNIHLYLGLFAGAVFTIIGLTGSMMAFRPELDEWLNPGLMRVNPKSEPVYRPLNAIVAAAKAAVPPDGSAYALVFPGKPDTSFAVTYSRPAPVPEQLEWHQVFIDPYTAKVKGQRLMLDLERPWRGAFLDFMLRLHYTLALGDVGSKVVGLIALALLFSILTGLILWWPKSGKFRQAVTIKRRASAERFIFDLHKTVGFYFAVMLFISLFSGVYLVFPAYVEGLIGLFSEITPTPEQVVSTPAVGKEPIGFDRAAAITDKRFPDGTFKWIFFPQGGNGCYRIVKKAPEERTDILPSRTLWVDQYSGAILHEYDPKDYTAGDAFKQWLYPLHSGEAFGLPGRVLILTVGCVPIILYVTGFIRWLQKRRARKA